MQIKFGNLTVEITYNKNTMREIDPTKLSREVSDKYQVENNTFKGVPKPDPKDKIDIEIGDSKQPDFKPQVKIMRWDNESNVSLRLVHDEKTPIVATEASVIKWQGDKIEAHFYELPISEEHPEGASEFEVILKEKPDTNVIQFTLVDKDVDYFYQPELTDEEVKEMADREQITLLEAKRRCRPENIVGSYAVYASENKTNYFDGKEYKTGKIGHIYRPRIEDSDSNWVWGELLIENGILSVTIPQGFLDKAVYPIRHATGLTFGYTTAGASRVSGGPNFIQGYKFTGQVGTATSISFYGYYISTQTYTKFALYKFSDDTLVSNSITGEVTNVSGSPNWNTGTCSGSASISNIDYRIALARGGSGNTWYYYDNATSGGSYYLSISYASVFPDPITWGGNNFDTSLKYSIYCTYTAGGGGSAPSIESDLIIYN